MSKKGLIARTSALLLLPAAFAATAFTAVGCGDDAKTPDAGIDAPPPPPAALSMTPQTGDFGSVTVGDTSQALSFTVSNTGGTTSGSISAIASGTNSSDFAVQTTCTTLAPAGTCVVTVTFSPTTAGADTANLVVSGSPGGTVMATLNGAAVNPGALTITPGSLAFGDQINATTSATTQTFTVKNTGGVTTGTLLVTPAGSDPSQFTKSADTCNGMTLAAAATCTFAVAFSPTSIGAKSASYDVTANPGGTVSGAVSGNSLAAAHVAINPSVSDFGSVVVGSSSLNTTFTLGNTGGFATGALTAPVLSGTDAASWSIVNQNCTGLVLTPNLGNSCNVVLKFTPGTAGAKTASLAVTGTPGGTATASLTGAGISGSGITILPSTQNYGNTNVGSASASQMFTVTNGGGSPTAALTTALGGTNPGDFQVVAGSNACQGTLLAAGATCTISVTFNPGSGGNKAATLTIGNGGNVASAALTGVGIIPAHLSIAPTSKDYGSVTVMTNSAFQSFTVTNDGGTVTGAVAVALNGANSTEFNTPSTCAAIAPLGTCIVMVRFSPASIGNKSASLDITSPGANVSAPLSGIGISNAQIAANPASLTFNDVLEGSTDTTQTFTVINNGATTTTALSVALSGTNAADYSVAGCTGATLMFGQTCVVTVTYAPKAGPAGGRTAIATVSAATGGTATVGLSGSTEPAIQIIAPTTATVDFGTINVNCVGAGAHVNPLTGTNQALAHAGTGANCPSNTITLQNNTGTAQTVTVTAAGPGWVGTAPSPYQFTGGVSCLISGTQAFDNTKVFTFTMNPPILGIIDQCTITTEFAPTISTLNTQTASVTFSIGTGGPFNTQVQDYTGVGTNAQLSITPNPFDYGSVSIQSMGKTQVFTVSNQTGQTTGVLQTEIGSSADDDYHVVADSCAGTKLMNNATCTFTLLFRPLITGAQPLSAAISGCASVAEAGGVGGPPALVAGGACGVVVRDSMGGVNTAEAAVTGTGVNQAQIAMSETTHNFGTIVVGESSDAPSFHDVTVTNTGGADSAAITVTLTGGANGYTLTNTGATDCMSGVTRLGANGAVGAAGTVANCHLRLRFSPTGAHIGKTTLTGNIVVSAPALMGGTATDTFTGISESAFHLTMTTTNYGDVVLGRTQDELVTAVNDSAIQAITINAITTNNAEFTVVNNMCGSPIPAGVGQMCTFNIRFAPAGSAGPRQNVTVTAAGTNGGGLISTALSPTRNDTIPAVTTDIQGNGRSKATLSFAPPTFDFGSALSGSAQVNGSFTEQFVLSNTGFDTTGGAVTVNITGNAAMDYTLLAGGALAGTIGSCGTPAAGAITVTGVTLLGGQSCTINVQFKPLLGDNGVINGTLNASATNAGPPVYMTTTTASLTGTGLANGAVTVSPTATDFGPRAVGSTSATQTFAVTNGGGSTVNLTNSIPTDFVRDNTVATNCGATLAAGATCNVGVKFSPATAGAKAVQLVIVAGTYVSLQGVGLTAGNIGGLVAEDFGIVRIAGGAKLLQIVLTNNNAGATGLITTPITGTDLASFTSPSTGDTCSGTSLAPGGSCTLAISFTPSTFGPKMATLTFTTANGLAGAIPLTGSGANDPAITISPTTAIGTPVDSGMHAMGKQTSPPTIFTVSNHANSFKTGHIGIQITGGSACTNTFGTNVSYAGCDFVLTTTGVTTPCHLDTTTTAGDQNDIAGTSLGDGMSCSFGVLFNPLHVGALTATITVKDTPGTGSVSGGTLNAFVSGTGTNMLTASCGACGNTTPVALGTGATPVDIVFTNNASIASDPIEEVQTGLGTQVSVISDNCIDAVLAPSGTCTVRVQYFPDGSGGPTNAQMSLGYYGIPNTGGLTTTSPPYGATDRFAGNLIFLSFTP